MILWTTTREELSMEKKSDSYYYDDTTDQHLRDPDDELAWYPGPRKTVIVLTLLALAAFIIAFA